LISLLLFKGIKKWIEKKSEKKFEGKIGEEKKLISGLWILILFSSESEEVYLSRVKLCVTLFS